jgi:hypothetical protein
MLLTNVVASFTGALVTPSQINNSGEFKYRCNFLIAPDHPQLNQLRAEFENVKNAGFPSGMHHQADICLQQYDMKYQGKDYYDARFSGWWTLSAAAKVDSKPSLVDTDMQPIIDPSKIFSGMLCHVNFNMFSFTQGKTGVAAGLNGVMILGIEGPMGRLDNKPTVEQMFSGLSVSNRPNAAPVDVAARQGTNTAQQNRRPPPPPPVANVKQMTAKAEAEGYDYDYLKQANWTDQQMIQAGYLVPPAVTPSFAS